MFRTKRYSSRLSLETHVIDLVAASYESYKKAVGLRQTLAGDQKELEKRSATETLAALKAFDQKAAAMPAAKVDLAEAAEVGAEAGRLRRSPR